MNRTNEQQKEYWKNNPDKYEKMKEKQRRNYQHRKIKEGFRWIESSLNI